MKRYIPENRKTRHSNGRTNLIGVITFAALLSGILLYFTNEKQNEQILQSYCGDFGIYGKSLALMRDSTFRFSYHGCSQANGFVAGNWSVNGAVMSFSPKHPDEHLDTEYQVKNYELIPVNEPEETKFTRCEYYKDQLERTLDNKSSAL